MQKLITPMSLAGQDKPAAIETSAGEPRTISVRGAREHNLANVDMASFQGVDWSSIYGVGMYV